MTDQRSVILGRIARFAAVAIALAVLGWLVVQAQRNADRGAAPAAPVPTREDAPSPEGRLLRDPVVGPVEAIEVPPDQQTFLFSSKSAAPLVSSPQPAAPMDATGLLPSSKSGPPLLPRSTPSQRQ
jgi:hypothetical protein